MMLTQSFTLVLFSILSVQATSIEEARIELELAKSTVISAINRADSMLNYYHDMFITKSTNVLLEGTVLIQSEEQTFFGQVTAIEELGQSAGVDISSCLVYPEEEIRNLTNVLTEDLQQCISKEIVEGAKILEEFIYITDIQITRLYSVEFQLGLCDVDNEDCILPLYELIIWEKHYRGEVIEVSVIQANNLFNALNVIVQECQDLNVSEQVNYVNSILREVSECADSLIG